VARFELLFLNKDLPSAEAVLSGKIHDSTGTKNKRIFEGRFPSHLLPNNRRPIEAQFAVTELTKIE